MYEGDVGKMDEHGNVYIVDRLKDVIKYKGAHTERSFFISHSLIAHNRPPSRPRRTRGDPVLVPARQGRRRDSHLLSRRGHRAAARIRRAGGRGARDEPPARYARAEAVRGRGKAVGRAAHRQVQVAARRDRHCERDPDVARGEAVAQAAEGHSTRNGGFVVLAGGETVDIVTRTGRDGVVRTSIYSRRL